MLKRVKKCTNTTVWEGGRRKEEGESSSQKKNNKQEKNSRSESQMKSIELKLE